MQSFNPLRSNHKSQSQFAHVAPEIDFRPETIFLAITTLGMLRFRWPKREREMTGGRQSFLSRESGEQQAIIVDNTQQRSSIPTGQPYCRAGFS